MGNDRRTALWLGLAMLILALAAGAAAGLWLDRPPAAPTPAPTPTNEPQALGVLTLPSPTPGPTATPATPAVDLHLPDSTMSNPERDDGTPTRIQAPAIGLDAPVVEVMPRPVIVGDYQATEWPVPGNAAGYHSGSAYPGYGGNTVISGHHNLGTEVFRYLIDLEIGDEVILHAGQARYTYTVAEKELFPEKGTGAQQQLDNGRWIAPTTDERLTLVTCWPYSGNSHRLVIVARP
ncbi:MAG TPA: sortase [Anaerolineae bacterium]|nr:sortase [Anaerolineae bacterium]